MVMGEGEGGIGVGMGIVEDGEAGTGMGVGGDPTGVEGMGEGVIGEEISEGVPFAWDGSCISCIPSARSGRLEGTLGVVGGELISLGATLSLFASPGAVDELPALEIMAGLLSVLISVLFFGILGS